MFALRVALRLLPPLLLLIALAGLSPRAALAREGGHRLKSHPLQPSLTQPGLPDEYGSIIYRQGERFPGQIYIVGQSHRSAVTGENGPDTLRSQIEIYRIGEWLLGQRNVELLLPEGYLRKKDISSAGSISPAAEPAHLDNQTLLNRLSDTRRFVNADMLLKSYCNIRLGQVEDRGLYGEVRRLLEQTIDGGVEESMAELVATQKKRTEAMVRNIPGVVEEAFESGRICSRRAIFTIGMAHLRDIIEMLEGEGPLPEQGYGVTVILPRTLADNRELLRLTGLARN